MREVINAYKVLVRKPGGKILFEILRYTWEVNIKIYIKKR
jgi:hypothetical protein